MARAKRQTAPLAIAPLKIVSDAPEPALVAPDRIAVIRAPNFETALLKITGTAPYVQSRFSAKSKNTIIATQEAGSQARKGRARKPKDFDAAYREALYVSREGWHGIPASAFRLASISACRTVGYRMTLAKLSIFVVADGFDAIDNTPLVRITKGEPFPHTAHARNADGSTDIRCRPMWDPGWEATVRMRWDADQFSASDIANLMARVGLQVGIGEGRADSRNSAGCGWGEFHLG